jgi:hypothetical protein
VEPRKTLKKRLCRSGQQLANLAVSGLGKVLVPQANRVEGLGRERADDLVHLVAELVAGLGRGDGHADHEAGQVSLADAASYA